MDSLTYSGVCRCGRRMISNTANANLQCCGASIELSREGTQSFGTSNAQDLSQPSIAMGTVLQSLIPDAFNSGCSGCKDVLRILNAYTIERASIHFNRLAAELYRVTQLRGKPNHVAALTIDDCRRLISQTIIAASTSGIPSRKANSNSNPPKP